MDRRSFIGLLFIPLISACSQRNITVKKHNKLTKKDSYAIYDYIKESQERSFSKYNNSVGILDHNAAWFYGPNITLSKEDLQILNYTKSNTVFLNMGLKDRFEFILNDITNTKNINYYEFGFRDSKDMFLSIYDRLSNSTRVDFYHFLLSLNENKIQINKITEVGLYNLMFSSYKSYKLNFQKYGFWKNKKFISLDIYYYRAYAMAFSIMSEMIKKNIKRGDIYGL